VLNSTVLVYASSVTGVTATDSINSAGSTGTGTTLTTTLAAPAVNNEIAFCGGDAYGQLFTTGGTSFTDIGGYLGGSDGSIMSYQTITGGAWGNSSHYTPSISGSTGWALNCMTFKGAANAGTSHFLSSAGAGQ